MATYIRIRIRTLSVLTALCLLSPVCAQGAWRTVQAVSTTRYVPEQAASESMSAVSADTAAPKTGEVVPEDDRPGKNSLTRDAQGGLTLQVVSSSWLAVRLVGDGARASATPDIYAVKVADGVYRFEGQTGRFDIDGPIEKLHLTVVDGSGFELSGVRPRQELDVTVRGGGTFRIHADSVADKTADTLARLSVTAGRWGFVSAEAWPSRQAQVSMTSLSSVGLNAASVVRTMSGDGGVFANHFVKPNAEAMSCIDYAEARNGALKRKSAVSGLSTAADSVAAVGSPGSSGSPDALYVYTPPAQETSSVSGGGAAAEPLTWVQDWAGGYVDGFLPRAWRKKHRFRGHWMGLEFGYNYYHTAHGGLGTVWPENPNGYENLQLNYGKSGSFAWNVFQVSVGFNSVHWGLVTGMGFQWDNYRFDEAATVPMRENGNVAFHPYAGGDERHYIKSKMGVSYFRIPVLFEYNHAERCGRSSFHVSLGAIPAVKMMAWAKQKYEAADGRRHKDKSKGDLYINPFKVDVVASVGWGPLSVYFSYTPTRLFLKNKAVDLTPFGFGIWLGIF